MSRYIDADDAANAIYHHFPSIRTMADARGIIEEAPSIDIVFCKECRWWSIDNNACLNNNTMPWGENDFCSNGERKESE